MTRTIEDRATTYLLTEFKHPTHEFKAKNAGDEGFDLWLEMQGQSLRKVELKATELEYMRPSNLFERLVFSGDSEKRLFESGESVIARVFLGSVPPRVFIITNAIFAEGAQLTTDERYILRGKINYAESITELVYPDTADVTELLSVT